MNIYSVVQRNRVKRRLEGIQINTYQHTQNQCHQNYLNPKKQSPSAPCEIAMGAQERHVLGCTGPNETEGLQVRWQLGRPWGEAVESALTHVLMMHICM